jgi:tetratricopeptide (TPR) repeat protein
LDDILKHYPTAEGSLKKELNDKLEILKSMSDKMIEEWLLFEDKLRKIPAAGANANFTANPTYSLVTLLEKDWNMQQDTSNTEDFRKGQGYYKLFMFKQAIQFFETVVRQQPDFLIGRLYLALSYLKIGEFNEAYPHFQLIIPLTDNKKIKAVSYNALGCIQAQNRNTEKACEYFKAAYQMDPSIIEPLTNMEVCIQNSGILQCGAEFTH